MFLFGLLFILIGIILVFIWGILMAQKTKEAKLEGGVIFWIGPFPFAITTSKQVFYFLLFVSVIFIFIILIYSIKR